MLWEILSLRLFNPSFPDLLPLPILHHCKLLPLSFVLFFSFLPLFLSHRRPVQAAPSWSVPSALRLSPVLAWGSCGSDPAADPAADPATEGPHLHPSVKCSPSHHQHRWASSSQTGSWTGTCAPQASDHARLLPPLRRYSLQLVPVSRKKGKSKNHD